MGIRRLWALVNGLPDDSATYRDTWTLRDELAAGQIEVIDLWGRVNARLHGVKPSSLPDPIRIPRPGTQEPEKPRVVTDPREIAAWFARNA